MPMRNVQFANDEFYHLIKRGVEERKIFMDDEDRVRFLNSLLIFNDVKPATWGQRSFWYSRDPASLMIQKYEQENPLVEIHAFALMDNHFHLLVRQIYDNGISIFMNKLGGYSYYFNKKYHRTGSLFQGRFKAVLIRTDEQLRNAFVYVTTNPIAFLYPGWKEKGIENFQKARDFLEKHQWSSYQHYIKDGDSPLIKKEFFLEVFKSKEECKEEVEGWLKHKVEVAKYKDIALEIE